jgi:hypothetical protein
MRSTSGHAPIALAHKNADHAHLGVMSSHAAVYYVGLASEGKVLAVDSRSLGQRQGLSRSLDHGDVEKGPILHREGASARLRG